MVAVLKYIFMTIPLRMARVIAQNSLVQKMTYVMSRSFSFVYWLLYNIGYFFKLFGIKAKFLWDTLDHYLLIKKIGRLFWTQKYYSMIGIAFFSYFGYFRSKYFVNPQAQKVLLFEMAK